MAKKKEEFPRIIIVAKDEDIQQVGKEFYELLGSHAFGMRICNLEEAIEKGLPINKAMEDFSNKIPNDIVLAKGVDELVPVDYVDPDIDINIDSIVFDSDEQKVEIPIGIKAQGRNESCACGSGKKFKKCCNLKIN